MIIISPLVCCFEFWDWGWEITRIRVGYSSKHMLPYSMTLESPENLQFSIYFRNSYWSICSTSRCKILKLLDVQAVVHIFKMYTVVQSVSEALPL